MGLDSRRFAGKVHDEFKCSICCDIVDRPVQIHGCEHVFCRLCLDKWLDHSNTCPIDRLQVTPEQVGEPSRFFRTLYYGLCLKCEFAANGCDAVLRLDELDSHTNECEYSPRSRKCRNRCGAELIPNVKGQTEPHNCITYLLAIVDDKNKIIADLTTKFAKQIEQNIKLKLMAVNGLASDEFRYKINSLKAQRVIRNNRVESLLLSFDRKLFYGSIPYNISPQSIGYGAQNNSLKLDAQILDLLSDHLVEGVKVLNIGSGLGYLTACMALMVGSSGKTVAVEHCPQLLQQSQQLVGSAFGDLLTPKIKFVCADGREGYLREAPFDVILVEAAITEFIDGLLNQLKTGGRMVAAIGSGSNQKLETIDRLSDGTFKREVHVYVSMRRLTGLESQLSQSSN